MNERWPTRLDPPGARGILRREPEDFQVEEIPAYLPSGRGEHLMVRILKRGRTTDEVIRALARHLGLPPGQVGCAGMKDRRAVTIQWVSVPAKSGADLGSFTMDDVTILCHERHGNKIKTGHLKGNSFRIRIRDIEGAAPVDLVQRAERLARLGAPNYFGPQRFGPGNQNEIDGMSLLRGKLRGRRDRRQLRFLLSAAQSGLFNDVLARRIRGGHFDRVLEGDVLVKSDSGGTFLCTHPEVDQPRMDAFEVHPTGPIFGAKMKSPHGAVAAVEADVLLAAGLDDEAWKRFPKLTRGTRRALRVRPVGLEASAEGRDLHTSFVLPPGSYATSVLRELVAYREAAR